MDGGGNVWELVEDATFQRSRSHSPSKTSKLSELIATVEEIEQDVDPETLSMVLRDEQHRLAQGGMERRKSKSPAIQSLKRFGQSLKRRLGLGPRDQILTRSPELPYYPLDSWVRRDTMEESISTEILMRSRPSTTASMLSPWHNVPIVDQQRPSQHSVGPEDRIHVYDPCCPIHGSRRRIASKRDRLQAMHKFTLMSIDTVDEKTMGPMLYSQAYAAKLIRKKKRAELSGDEKIKLEKEKNMILSNLWIISVAFLFLFSAFNGLQNLQTSVNGYLGAQSLAILYLTQAISSLFIPSFMINRLGCKLTLLVSMIIYICFMFANFLSSWSSMISAAILCGIAGSCLFAAQCLYIAVIGLRYSQLNIEGQNVVIVRFFGYFFMIVHMGQVFGNLVSSLLLTSLISHSPLENRVDESCGHSFVDDNSTWSERALLNLRRPSQAVFVSLCGLYVCLAIVATMIIAMFLNSLHLDKIARKKPAKYSTEVLEIVWRSLQRIRPVLLIPLTLFNGFEQAFIVGIYTKAYVGCGMGISHIGFTMTAFGVTDAIFSLVFGPLMKLFGRMPLFVFGAVINMLMIFTLRIWTLNPGDTALFYVIGAVWGMADGVWNTQLSGFWAALTGPNMELALVNYRFWNSMGLAIGLSLTGYVNTETFLHIALVLLLLGIIGYLLIEFHDPIRKKVKECHVKCASHCKEKTNNGTKTNERY